MVAHPTTAERAASISNAGRGWRGWLGRGGVLNYCGIHFKLVLALLLYRINRNIFSASAVLYCMTLFILVMLDAASDTRLLPVQVAGGTRAGLLCVGVGG